MVGAIATCTLISIDKGYRKFQQTGNNLPQSLNSNMPGYKALVLKTLIALWLTVFRIL